MYIAFYHLFRIVSLSLTLQPIIQKRTTILHYITVLNIIISSKNVYFLIGLTDGVEPCVVSGLSSSKVSVCSMLIKEFCGGKAGWNDRAVFIKTDLSLASEQSVAPHLMFSNLGQSNAKRFCPLPYQNSYAFDLRNSTKCHPSVSSYVRVFKVPFQHTPTSPNWSLW